MKPLILSLVAVLLFSCNPWKYAAEYDHKVDFNSYKTFGLLNWDRHNDDIVSPQAKEYILMAIKEELEARGYVYQKTGAEMLVSIFAIVQEETNYSAYSNHYAGYSGYGSIGVGVSVGSQGTGVGVAGYGMGPAYPYTVYKNDYEVGTLIIDLLDDSKKQIIWQGVASGRLSNEEATENSVKNKMSRLFGTLPVKKVKK